MLFGVWEPGVAAAVFAIAGVATALGGVRLVGLGDTLADRTGWGEAFFGAVFFGLITSLSGIVMTAVSAAVDQPELAYSNAVGGIAAQTLAIVIADAAYRNVNLEHAAASEQNMLFGCLLIVLLSTALLGSFSPEATVAGVHPASVVMVALYAGGLQLIRSHHQPMWTAVATGETRLDRPAEEDAYPQRSSAWLWTRFALIASGVVVSGWAVARAAESLVVVAGLQAGFVGGVLMGVVNALPEAVAAIAAVRRGALTLAIAAVIGGNALDALNLVVGDLVFRGGSLYHRADTDQLFLTTASLLMTAILLGGLLVRQRRGWLRLGFDGVVIAAIYAAAVLILAF
ncbi:sodium:calcium antiporter [Glycomyces halotolerans]